MNRDILAAAICASLALQIVPVRNAQAQDTSSSNASGTTSSEKKELEKIVVTGSIIPQSEIETASPVITITSKQIEKQGFGNVYDALRALPLATGAVQDSQFTAGFTPGANALRLLGLDPGFTLNLINGHPMADYPLLYNGSSNFVDLSDIPSGMVDHIDILPGNQSSIYGSSAIAGVINIILKDKLDGMELNVRGGTFSDGGGQNERAQFLGGHSWGNLDVLFGVQLSNQKPIWGFQRDQTQSSNANPNPNSRYGSRTFLYNYIDLNDGSTHYVDPGENGCDGLSNLFGGTTTRDNRPGRGYYCGSRYQEGYSTIYNANKSGTGYLDLKYKLDSGAEIYGDILYNVSSIRFSGGPHFWQPSTDTGGYFWNDQSDNPLQSFQHIFAPEETGGLDSITERQIERSYNAWGGVRGTIGSDWDYDAYAARSQQNLTDKQYWPLKDAVNDFFAQQFLGPQLGTYYGYPIYHPNVSNYYQPLTPGQYRSFTGLIDSDSKAWTQNLNLKVSNTNLFSLPAGPVGFGGVLQVGNQYWNNGTDPRVVNGDFWGLTGTSGSGNRDNWAIAGELQVPIVNMLTANASVRYDKYENDGGGSDDKTTYKLGLEFRPTDALLFRANYATAFRAPDMAYSFGGSSGFFTSGTDYYRCAVSEPGTPISDCTYNPVSIFGLHEGNRDLKSITAKSWGGGIVWSPTADFNIKADYYHINISNEVQLQDLNTLLRTEAACRLGQLDPTSPTCITAISQVQRSPADSPNPNVLQQVTVLPINVSRENVSGIIASLNYRMDAGRVGKFQFNADYHVTLKHEQQQFPGDPTIDFLRNPFYSTDFKSIFAGSITWDIDKWSTTLRGTRYGSTPNYIAWTNTDGYAAPGAGRVDPWILYNGSVTYSISDDMNVSFIVNNIRNSKPPKDPTWTTSPYYNYNVFNPFGRELWLEFDWRFGRTKS